MGFTPISIRDYVRFFLQRNRGESADRVAARLQAALADHKAGLRCACGQSIGIIGSAEAGRACFTCITGEAEPSDDYEIVEAAGQLAGARPRI